MCRLFGYRSAVPGQVHPSLVLEQNSLRQQSHEHKDGWGIAYYDRDLPEVAHGLGPAHGDPDFERVSSLVTSHAVLAHVRLASVGKIALENAHPFLLDRWAFAHNGTIRDFAKHQRAIEAEIDPEFLARIRGETDSERCFYLLLTRLKRSGALERPDVPAIARALAEVTRFLSRLTDRPDAEKPSSMNFLITDGKLMVATRRNRTLFFSERKPAGAHAAHPHAGMRLERIIIASEKLELSHHWHEVPEGSIVGVDAELRLHLFRADELVGTTQR